MESDWTYQLELLKRLRKEYAGDKFRMDGEGDIWHYIPGTSDIDEVYESYLNKMKSFPEIEYKRARVGIYICDGNRTYKHLINPNKVDIERYYKVNMFKEKNLWNKAST